MLFGELNMTDCHKGLYSYLYFCIPSSFFLAFLCELMSSIVSL